MFDVPNANLDTLSMYSEVLEASLFYTVTLRTSLNDYPYATTPGAIFEFDTVVYINVGDPCNDAILNASINNEHLYFLIGQSSLKYQFPQYNDTISIKYSTEEQQDYGYSICGSRLQQLFEQFDDQVPDEEIGIYSDRNYAQIEELENRVLEITYGTNLTDFIGNHTVKV